MPRWKPDARVRLIAAAVELFAENGYENTTVIEIAERAGLTKSTFFRHFPDKREVLFGGGEVAALLERAIEDLPAELTPREVIAAALDAVGSQTFTPETREFSARRRAVIADNPELQEREALKGLSITAALTDGLVRRGVPELAARIAAEFGALAMDIAYERWSGRGCGDDFGVVARRALDEVYEASTQS
ncbi:TetR/AcrR family transcriptional regulator [Microbacterium sp. MPKO10]|uniref:TetR/AcrR family transcriptional regulator n=1 Tax=Microbacterium sp. MPKO10 TaxID=2989818 RepID=UPI00223551E5|nr:TetR/AcrR family transcriptional regulator [Microbacterium sp. MPKO10]MCW4457211.1 TetR/AcrR family transcriptional regulator [Microbacterium sp. MPKO10]